MRLPRLTPGVTAALFCFLISQVVYIKTLAPTVTTEDSGELITAAVCFGVPHPPGYPLWTLLGHVFSQLPGATPAWWVNYMSAFFAGLTAAVLCFIGMEVAFGALLSAAISLMYAFSLSFWSQSVIAEVYTLNAFLFSLILYFLLRYRKDDSRALVYGLALCFGLGLANHYMLVFVVSPPIFLYFFWSMKRKRQLERGRVKKSWEIPWSALLISGLIVSACLLIYGYLPWAASGNPPMNWGDPSDFNRLWALITRQQYRRLEFASTVTIGTKLLFLGQFLSLFLAQFTPYLCVPGLALFFAIKDKAAQKAEMLLLWGVFLFNGVVLIWVLRFTFEGENKSRVEEYYLQAWMCAALLIGMGLGAWLEGKGRRAAIAVCGCLVIIPLAANFSHDDYSRNYLALDYNKAILESLEKDAIYFPAGDFNSFPVVYLQVVEKLRPDLLIADVTGGLSKPALDLLAKIGATTAKGEAVKDAQELLAQWGERPMYFTDKSDCKIRKGYGLKPWGWVYRLVSAKSPFPSTPPPKLSFETHLRNQENPTKLDSLGDSILSSVCLMDGENAFVGGNVERAFKCYEKAFGFSADSKEGMNNLGSTVAERKQFELAIKYFRKAADAHPGYLTARRNLAQTLRDLGRLAEAAAVYRELLYIEPDNASLKELIANLEKELENPQFSRIQEFRREMLENGETAVGWNNMGNLYAELKDEAEALKAYNKAMELDPKYPTVYKNLALFHKKLRNDEKQYEYYMKKYEELKARK